MEQVTIRLDGIPELIKELKGLDDKFKKRSLKRILRAAGKPLIERMKLEAPVGKRNQTGKYKHTKGNLQRSIGMKITRNLVGYIGPNRKKGVDAFYQHIVIGGQQSHPITYKGRRVTFKSKTGKIVTVSKAIHPGASGNNFVGKAFRGTYTQVMETMKTKSLQEIERIWKLRKKAS